VSRTEAQVEALRGRRLAAGARPIRELTVAEARAADDGEETVPAPDSGVTVDELDIPGPAGILPARLYSPRGAPGPGVVYFSGGGWVMGSLDGADAVCRRLARATKCRVVAVEYRRAPEHRFPAAVDDCYASVQWVAENATDLGIDPSALAVGGVSAGGNLAAAVTLLARDREHPRLAFQFLVYPPLDHRADTPSRREMADPLFFDRDDVAWCWRHYLRAPADGDDPLASPLRAADLNGLPPALVITAERDPLRDEAELYAARLADSGVPTELVRFAGMVHGFFSLIGVVDAAAEAQELTAAALRRALLPGYAPS
jgi:acetyl esterase